MWMSYRKKHQNKGECENNRKAMHITVAITTLLSSNERFPRVYIQSCSTHTPLPAAHYVTKMADGRVSPFLKAKTVQLQDVFF